MAWIPLPKGLGSDHSLAKGVPSDFHDNQPNMEIENEVCSCYTSSSEHIWGLYWLWD